MAFKQEDIIHRRTEENGDIVLQFPITRAANIENLIDLIYPIGTLFWNESADVDPNKLYAGTTWEQIKDTFILAAGDTYTAGVTGGAATVSLTTENMPAHTHTRGTMDITGTLTSEDYFGLFAPVETKASGAFVRGSTSGKRRGGGGDSAFNPKSLSFTASNNWTGATSSVGSGTAHNNMPPYVTMYCWKRTA